MKIVIRAQAIFRGFIVRNQVRAIRIKQSNSGNIFRNESKKNFNPIKFTKIVKKNYNKIMKKIIKHLKKIIG